MCIVLLSTAHPDYPLVLLDNRDEFITRPTSRVAWWAPPGAPDAPYVLSAVDLLRPEHGTWMGITRQGRLAVLTNYREDDVADAAHPVAGTRSRGSMVTNWLTSRDAVEDYLRHLIHDEGGVSNVGGFSLIFGKLHHTEAEGRHRVPPLALISNRASDVSHTIWLSGDADEVYGLSNSAFLEPWPKVEHGKELLAAAVKDSVAQGESREQFTQRLFGLLDTDTLPPRPAGMSFEHYLDNLRYSIFIPPIGGRKDYEEYMRSVLQPTPVTESHPKTPPPSETDMTGVYGTQRQTIVLVDKKGHVTYVERRLFDDEGRSISRGDGDQVVEFDIEGW
ncbi:DUF833-domain-containing protein [Auricularia subglabra TFB-10046 SS5]|nr:DUF833-domain-containing protein [Auricularia subglabra TFB-10046 SS5]